MLTANSIHQDDCLHGMALLPDGCLDLVVTDPPYLISYKTNYRKDKQHDFCTEIQNDDNEELIRRYISECYRLLKMDTAMYLFCSSKTLDYFRQCAVSAGFLVKNTIVWVKNNWTAGDLYAQFGQQYEPLLLLNKGRRLFTGERLTDVRQFPRVAGKAQLHQNQKPVELIEQCILKHSEPGDLIFDGFMGSGTTAVAAIRTDRRFLGFEIEKRYYDLAQNRVSEELETRFADIW